MSKIRNAMKRTASSLARLVLGTAAALPATAPAAELPDAGSALRETRPPATSIPPSPELAPAVPAAPAPAAKPGGPSVTLKAIRFSGNTAYSSAELQALVADRIGQPNTLADLEALAGRITEKYRADGYLLAQAIVPVQDVTSGEVEISVIEGVLGKVRLEIDESAPVAARVIEGITARLEPGRPLQSRKLERVMLLLSDLPGVAPQASLEQGDEAGTVDLVVSVAAQRRWSFALDGDNHGSRSTGQYRIGATGRINSPLRRGDNLDMRAQWGSGGGLAYGRIGYELPLDGDGTRLGVSATLLDYELGGDFAALDASGEAEVLELSVTHPLLRSRARNLFVKASVQRKAIEDRLRATGLVSDKQIRSANLGFAFEQRDGLLGGGYTSAGLTVTLGELELEDAAQRQQDRAGLDTAGHFGRISYAISRLNALYGKTNLFVGLTGQRADRNLDSAEKIALGGPRAVRAYAPAEATVDEGQVANLELRYSLRPDVSLQAFHDWGWGRVNRNGLVAGEDNDVQLRGYGLGVFWSGPRGITLRASAAWRTAGPGATAPDRVPRVYVQLAESF